MSVAVHLPFVLQGATGKRERIVVEADTVAQAIDRALREQPSFRRRCLDADALASGLVKVFLDGEDIRFLAGLDTALEPFDTITIVAGPEPSQGGSHPQPNFV